MVLGLENECGIVVTGVEEQRDRAQIASWIAHELARKNPNGFDNPIGGRFYLDAANSSSHEIPGHEHFEGCTPECAGKYAPRSLALYNRAIDRIVLEQFYDVCRRGHPEWPAALKLHLVKGSTDWKGNWYGSQLNLRIPSSLGTEVLAEYLIPYLGTKIIWAGQGGVRPLKAGAPLEELILGPVQFVFSPRTSNFVSRISTQTTSARPFISTAKFGEPQSYDFPEWHRLQLLCDPLLSDFTVYVDAGITALIIRLLSKGGFPYILPYLPHISTDTEAWAKFISEVDAVNTDPPLSAQITLAAGSPLTALEIQKRYFEILSGSEVLLGLTAEDKKILKIFGGILDDLESDPLSLSDRCECWLLYKLCQAKLDKCGTTWKECHNVDITRKGKTCKVSYELSMLAHQATALDSWGIWPRMVETGRVKTLYSMKEVIRAAERPPASRARDRKSIFDRARELGVSALMHPGDSWDTIVFNSGIECGSLGPSVTLRDPMGRDNGAALRKAEEIMQHIIIKPLGG